MLWPGEEPLVRESGFIPTNYSRWKKADGSYYEAGSVVFLIQDKGHNIELFRQYAASEGKEQGCRYLIRFDMEAEVEIDWSGWAAIGSVVHEGPIPLSAVANLEWIEIGAV